MSEALEEALRHVLSIHVDNRVDVPRILKMVLLTIREHGVSNVEESIPVNCAP